MEETISSDVEGFSQFVRPLKKHIEFETVDKLFCKLRFFAKYPATLRYELLKTCKAE